MQQHSCEGLGRQGGAELANKTLTRLGFDHWEELSKEENMIVLY